MEHEDRVREYLNKNPNYFSADQAKSFLPGYNGLNSSDYQKFSGAIADNALELFIKKNKNTRGVIYWTAGGTGSGKTEIAKKIIKLCLTNHCIYDSTLSNNKRSLNRIQRGIDNGFRQIIIYSHRPIEQSFTNGVLKRITRGEKRIVPIKDHVLTHINARQNIHELSNEYKNNESVQIIFQDNSHAGKQPKKQSLNSLEEHDINLDEQIDSLLKIAIKLWKEETLSLKQLKILIRGLL